MGECDRRATAGRFLLTLPVQQRFDILDGEMREVYPMTKFSSVAGASAGDAVGDDSGHGQPPPPATR